MEEKINYVEAALGMINKRITTHSEPEAYWLDGFGADPEPSYCYFCAEGKLKDSNKVAPDVEVYIMDDHGDPDEADTPVYCDDCGKPLKYILSEHGIGLELSHYSDRQFDLKSEEECHALGAILVRHGEFGEIDDQIVDLAYAIVTKG